MNPDRLLASMLNVIGRKPSRWRSVPMYLRYRMAWYRKYGDTTTKSASVSRL